MTIIIDDLPFPGEGVTPTLDQRDTDILKLGLQGAMLQNPLADDLTAASNSFSSVNSFLTGNLSQSSIDNAIDLVSTTPTDVDFTTVIQTQMLDDLDTLKATASSYSGISQLATDSTSDLLTHTNLLTENIGVADGITNQILTFPKTLTSDIPGGLPTDFPGIPQLSGLTNFEGLSAVPAIPSLGMSALPSVDALPNLGDLPGVNTPGIPDPAAVLSAVSGSILSPEYGGVGSQVAANASTVASAAVAGFSPMNSNVSDILGATTGADLAAIASSFNTNVADLTPGLDTLAGPFGDTAGGVSGLLNGEQDALFGGGCSTLVSGAGCGSASGALATTATVTNALKTQTGAQLIASTATPELSSILGGFS